MSEKITILFDGKDVEVTPYAPGVVQKTASIFYIQDCVSKEWLYSFPGRLAKLMAKNDNDLSQFKGRATKAAERTVAKAEKKAAKASKVVVAPDAPATEAPVETPADAELVPA